MTGLDVEKVRAAIDETTRKHLASFDVFADIESTNSYLMGRPGPEPGQMYVAVTDNQTAGRGRQGRTWQSPPGSGLALSLAYTFADSPDNLPALTLAIGLGAIEALEKVPVAGVHLKWPNDLVVGDGKLGGILTEAQARADGAVTVVTGIGINIDLGAGLDVAEGEGWSQPAVDLKRHADALPSTEELAGALIGGLYPVFTAFADSGFSPFVNAWQSHDWLFGREVVVDTAGEQVSGIGAGISEDGALLVNVANSGTQQIRSGTIVRAGTREHIA